MSLTERFTQQLRGIWMALSISRQPNQVDATTGQCHNHGFFVI